MLALAWAVRVLVSPRELGFRATIKPSMLGLHALTMRCDSSEPSGVRLRGVGVEFTGAGTGAAPRSTYPLL